MFWLVRVAEVTIYPLIARLVNFPRYPSSEWARVSRHKFCGLVGHDLIWCLYCDWMTGVWSLGSEMLRNVESPGPGVSLPARRAVPGSGSAGRRCGNCASSGRLQLDFRAQRVSFRYIPGGTAAV